MYLGRVVGTLVATRKDASLVGAKLLVTHPLSLDLKPIGEAKVMVDTVGAGVGEMVIYTMGTASRNAAGKPEAAIDAAVVGIVDQMDIDRRWVEELPDTVGKGEQTFAE